MKGDPNETLFPPPGRTPREDTAAVMKFFKLPKGFSADVMREAKAISALEADERSIARSGRLDLRKKFIFTCDPVTARDYDDAISLEKDRRGNRVLGVHIADVSHYVKPGSAIDREAFRRSTSVYLADRVVPMLPEALSNGVCSLVPGEDRFAFSVFMTFDSSGEMTKRVFAKSVIRSRARFTYEQVMRVISGGRKAKGGPLGPKERAVVLAVNELARELRAKRFAAGALDIEIPEAELILDGYGEMTGIVTRPYDDSHKMIEECMVAANEAVAKELWSNGVKILARLHEPPDEEKVMMLRAELRGLGVKVGNIENPKVFAQFLRSIKSHPLYPTIAVMALRSMKRAVYDSTTMGHFGLAKRYYAHFTSPIRRYPDLTLHRQLAAYLDQKAGVKGASAKVSPGVLAKWAEHASEMEEVAAEAERGLVEIKKYRLLESQLDSRQILDYDAVVSKCTPFGCFVEIPELAVSGLVHVSVLSRRFVRYNESDRTLSAPGGGSWRIGDRMKVHVAKVDFRQRRIDFTPCSHSRSR
ncbi:MAG: VacB/RNase II family 3'-5' exoribonuclease [Kiritimatiellae bacterium]|nr:VacB/RNase II family 3'-5' exoribonuclease [Kiritimatiellia bacterium]